MGEETKVAVRNLRRESNKDLKKAEKSEDLTEDDLKSGMDDVQKIVDRAVKDIDEVIAGKEKEIMEI